MAKSTTTPGLVTTEYYPTLQHLRVRNTENMKICLIFITRLQQLPNIESKSQEKTKKLCIQTAAQYQYMGQGKTVETAQ
jgi:hypothetical protein